MLYVRRTRTRLGRCAIPTARTVPPFSSPPGTNKVRGVARAWDLATGRAEPIGGTPPDNRVSDIVESADGLVVCAQDNSVYFVDAGAAPLQFGPKLSFENAPKQMSAAGSTVAVTSQSPRVRRSPQTHRWPQAQLACRPAARTHARALPHPHASTRRPRPGQNALLLIKAKQLQPEVQLDLEP